MSYCHLGNLQNIEVGLRRVNKINVFIGTVKYPQEEPRGIPKVLSYSITLTGTYFKNYFSAKCVALPRQVVFVDVLVLLPMKMNYTMTLEMRNRNDCNPVIS